MKNDRKNIMNFTLVYTLILIIVIFTIIGCFSDDSNSKQLKIDSRLSTNEISMDCSSAAEIGFVPLDVNMDEELQEFIYCLSYGYNIDFYFVMGLIEQESGFQTDVVSKTNDYGLMQINKMNHKWLAEQIGVTDFKDPYQNVRSGLYILNNLFEKYEDAERVLMAYNMGENGARKLWDKGVYETNYSKRVLEKVDAFFNE